MRVRRKPLLPFSRKFPRKIIFYYIKSHFQQTYFRKISIPAVLLILHDNTVWKSTRDASALEREKFTMVDP